MNENKTKEQLSDELLEMRRRYAELLERTESDRSEAEQALQKAKMLYDQVLGKASDAVIAVDQEGILLTWNPGAERIFGRTNQEALGEPFHELQTVDNGKEVKELIEQAFTGEIFSNVEVCWCRNDGTSFDTLTTFSPLTSGNGGVIAVQAVIKDITEPKRIEKALGEAHNTLEKTKQYLESLIESSTDAIIATDQEGRVVLFNEGAEALSGYRRDEVIGMRGPVLYENEMDAKAVMGMMRKGGGTVSGFETTFRAKDGNIIPVLISASILYNEEGQETGTVGFSKDLRDLKRVEEELRQAQSSALAADKLAALGRLTAGVSHEILNPIQVITLGLSMMLDESNNSREMLEDLLDMKDQADHITKIVQDLLSYARHRPLKPEPVDFNEMIEKTVRLVEHDLKVKNITVEFNLAENLPLVVGDRGQIQQVILNLITNACDAAPPDGCIVLRTCEGQPFLGTNRKSVEFRVEDTGPGIAPEDIDKIFDPFFTTKPEGKGTGLGLSICKGIVDAHGGAIRAENVPGSGASFTVQLGMEEG